MKHLLKCIAYLSAIGMLLGAFDVASGVAWASLQEFYYGEGGGSTAVYTTLAAVGIVFLGCEIFQLYSKYMTNYVGKPLLEKHQKELEANWLTAKKAIEDKLIEYAEELGRVRNDLHKSRATCQKIDQRNAELENQLAEAQEELSVLRGPLELSKTDTNA